MRHCLSDYASLSSGFMAVGAYNELRSAALCEQRVTIAAGEGAAIRPVRAANLSIVTALRHAALCVLNCWFWQQCVLVTYVHVIVVVP
jgi:hypothetical protein